MVRNSFGSRTRTAVSVIALLILAGPALAQPVDEARMNAMNHGPFVSATLTLDPSTPRGIIAHKAIVVRVGPDATMAFDTDLLRVVGGWTGGLLNWYPARDSLQEWPTPDGFMHFTNEQRPGWGVAPAAGGPGGGGRGRGAGPGGLNDSRPWRYGPLPASRRYTGLYQHGQDVVFAYTVGTSDILEHFGFERVQEQPLFLRTLQVNPSGQALLLHVLQTAEGRATSLTVTPATGSSGYVEIRSGSEGRLIGFHGLPTGAEWRLQNGHLVLALPAGQERFSFRLAVGSVRSGSDVGYMTTYLQTAAPVADLSALTQPGAPLWTPIETRAVMGRGDGAFAVDSLTLPAENPWSSHMRLSAVDFLSDGRAVVVSLSGDVWLVDGIAETLGTLRWQRFATGLNEPLGLRVVNDRIYVTGRDQITILNDRNNDGQADFYENFTNEVMAATNFHAFTLNLETDSRGNFYFAKATPWPPVSGGGVPAEITPHHGVLFRVSPDGRTTDIIATGLRNPNGLSVGPNDEIYYADNEGNWVPTSKVHRIREGGFHGFVPSAHLDHAPTNSDFVKPMVWLPYFIDNSPAQPKVITNPAWPQDLQGTLLLASYGRGTLSLLLPEEVDGQLQAGHVVLPLEFRSGLQHMRFHTDGHLYIAGMTNWQSTGHGQELGSLHRVRYTGRPLNLPVELQTKAGGLEIRFSEQLDPAVATNPSNYDLKQWTYAWNSSYGSRQGLFSVRNPGQVGPDPVEVRSVRLSADQRSVFLEVPSLVAGAAAPPVPMLQSLPDQIEASMGLVMAIDYKLRTAAGAELNQVVHKTIHRVPADGGRTPVAAASTTPAAPRPTPASAPTASTTTRTAPAAGRVVELRSTGVDLAYDVKEIVAKAGETLTVRFVNTSDMAHNVVLVKSDADVVPVGNAAARAYATNWVPAEESGRIIAATALAEPTQEVSMTFVVPPPGRYPYICTYSGHWTLMKGVLRSVE